MSEVNVPKLRFREFEGEWVEKRLKDITSKIGSGSTPRGGEKVYQSKGIPFIRSQNVKDDRLVLDDVTYISEKINLDMKNSMVNSDDILLNITGASIGRSCVVPQNFKEGNVNQHVCIIRLDKKNHSYFLQPLLSSYAGQKLIYQGQTGSGREGLNFKSIALFKFILPQKHEQQKIANFLTSIDQKIEQLTKKEKLLVAYKKGVMQKIFSQEIRFRDENGEVYGDWVERKLGEISIKKSSNISANTLKNNEGKYKIYGATGVLKFIDFFREEEKYISIVKDGAGVGRVFLCDKQSSVLGTLDILKAKKGINLAFLYLLLSRVNFKKYIVGSTIPHIYYKDYAFEKINLPPLKEQTKIANFLSSIDKKIEQVNRQIEESKGFKKGLLQGMFV